jgi:hypothetical protein
MNALQRLKKLEKNAQAAAYFFGTVYPPGLAESCFHAGLWQDFNGFCCCMKGNFFDTQREAEAWFVRELAGPGSLPVFYIESNPGFRLAKMALYTDGKLAPAQADQALWETINHEERLYV